MCLPSKSSGSDICTKNKKSCLFQFVIGNHQWNELSLGFILQYILHLERPQLSKNTNNGMTYPFYRAARGDYNSWKALILSFLQKLLQFSFWNHVAFKYRALLTICVGLLDGNIVLEEGLKHVSNRKQEPYNIFQWLRNWMQVA